MPCYDCDHECKVMSRLSTFATGNEMIGWFYILWRWITAGEEKHPASWGKIEMNLVRSGKIEEGSGQPRQYREEPGKIGKGSIVGKVEKRSRQLRCDLGRKFWKRHSATVRTSNGLRMWFKWVGPGMEVRRETVNRFGDCIHSSTSTTRSTVPAWKCNYLSVPPTRVLARKRQPILPNETVNESLTNKIELKVLVEGCVAGCVSAVSIRTRTVALWNWKIWNCLNWIAINRVVLIKNEWERSENAYANEFLSFNILVQSETQSESISNNLRFGCFKHVSFNRWQCKIVENRYRCSSCRIFEWFKLNVVLAVNFIVFEILRENKAYVIVPSYNLYWISCTCRCVRAP